MLADLHQLLAIPAAELVEDWQIDERARRENLNDVLQTMADDLNAYVAAVKAVPSRRLQVVPPRDEGEDAS